MSINFVSRDVVRRLSLALILGTLAAATGCASVSQRAWYNGRAMTRSWQYREVMAGNSNPANLRGIYYGSDALLVSHRSVQYPAFGHW
jgi:hypothetical protein